MTKSEYISEYYNIDELSLETPVGWSSICLDQTINYYIECNSTNSYEEYILEESSKD